MANTIPVKTIIPSGQIILVILASALFYVMLGAVMIFNAPFDHLLIGGERVCMLFAAGVTPLVVILLFLGLYRGKLTGGETRTCIIGTGVTSLVLVPLLGLVL